MVLHITVDTYRGRHGPGRCCFVMEPILLWMDRLVNSHVAQLKISFRCNLLPCEEDVDFTDLICESVAVAAGEDL